MIVEENKCTLIEGMSMVDNALVALKAFHVILKGSNSKNAKERNFGLKLACLKHLIEGSGVS